MLQICKEVFHYKTQKLQKRKMPHCKSAKDVFHYNTQKFAKWKNAMLQICKDAFHYNTCRCRDNKIVWKCDAKQCCIYGLNIALNYFT